MLTKRLREPVRSELAKLFGGLGIALAFVVVFLLALALKRKVHPSPIIYYEGILLIAALGAGALVVIVVVGRIAGTSRLFASHVVLGVFLGMVAAYSFHVTVPSLLDRSISMFVLSLLRSRPLTPSEVECNFIEQFIIRSGALDKRVKEQIATGNIDLHDGRLHMTDRGRFADASWIFMADVFAVRKDFVEVEPISKCDAVVEERTGAR